MLEPTETTPPWLPHLKLLIRAFVLSLLMLIVLRVWSRYVPEISSPMIQQGASALLLFLAMLSGFVGLACFFVGVIRWAGMDAKLPQLAANGVTSQETNRLLRMVNERILLSDAAKGIAYRERDRDALREAIREDIAKGELNAAMAMVKQMSHLHGYHEEADELREQIQLARAKDMDLKVMEATDQLNALLEKQEWEKATAETVKLKRRFPDSPRMRNLRNYVAEARKKYKHSLERRFFEAAQRDDVDLAIDLLHELDKYLTEAEAEPFRETARGVIGKKRDNLGVQFKLAIQDKDWTVAVRVGEQVISEFPNTKMADEVRGMIDVLRQRATDERIARN